MAHLISLLLLAVEAAVLTMQAGAVEAVCVLLQGKL
jgi:hypothetical protein